jgi:hypothetical protein
MSGAAGAPTRRRGDAQSLAERRFARAEPGRSAQGYLPARDLGAISVKQLLDIVRSAGESGFLNPASLPVPERVEQVLQQIDSSLGTALETMSVMDLCR